MYGATGGAREKSFPLPYYHSSYNRTDFRGVGFLLQAGKELCINY
jgi:hypothetical protein